MVKYFWSESNGVDRPTVNYKEIAPEVEYYVGMPLKIVDAETVEPTDGDPDYICMATYNKENDAAVLQIAVMEVFPDAVYERWNEDGTVEDVRFGGKGGFGGDLLETVTDTLFSVENAEFSDLLGTGLLCYMMESSLPLTNGETYSVIWDGQRFDCVAMVDGEISFLGNTIVMEQADTGEPFAYIYDSTAGVALFSDVSALFAGTTTNTTHTFAIIQEDTQLKPSLLPEHLQFGETVTSAPFSYELDVNNEDNLEAEANKGNLVIMDDLTILRVSDFVPTVDELSAATVTACVGGNDGSANLGEMWQENPIQDMTAQGVPLLSLIDSLLWLVLEDADIAGLAFKKGLWFIIADADQYMKSISIPVVTTGDIVPLPEKYIPELSHVILKSTTEGSTKKFKVTVDDTGALTAVEV